MARRALAELLSRAQPAQSHVPNRLRELPVTVSRSLALELEALLHLRNGFRALDGALYVRPSVTVAQIYGCDDWNALTLWRAPWRHATTLYFFAEDVHGRQFALHRHDIVRFDPATGGISPWADTLETWAARAQDEADSLGHAAVIAWESQHGPLRAHERLQPRDPTTFEELRVREDLELMRRWALVFRAHLARTTDPAAAPVDVDAWWGE